MVGLGVGFGVGVGEGVARAVGEGEDDGEADGLKTSTLTKASLGIGCILVGSEPADICTNKNEATMAIATFFFKLKILSPFN